MQLYVKLHHIDYGKMLSRIQDQNQNPKEDLSGCLGGLIRTFGKLGLLTNSFTIGIAKKFIKSSVTDLTKGYGIYLSVLEIRGITIIRENRGGDNMLNISASIANIDWDKLMDTMGGPAKKSNGNDDILREVVRIIKPFIGETMATIPNEAIAELFDLLARDKVIDVAWDYGVEVSDITVLPG